jgi:hypothetical protein
MEELPAEPCECLTMNPVVLDVEEIQELEQLGFRNVTALFNHPSNDCCDQLFGARGVHHAPLIIDGRQATGDSLGNAAPPPLFGVWIITL